MKTRLHHHTAYRMLGRMEYHEYFRFVWSISMLVVHLRGNDQRYFMIVRLQKQVLIQESIHPKFHLTLSETLRTWWRRAHKRVTVKHSPCPGIWITTRRLLAIVWTSCALHHISCTVHRCRSSQYSSVNRPFHLQQLGHLKVLALPVLVQCHQSHGLCFRHLDADLLRLLQLHRKVYSDLPSQSPGRRHVGLLYNYLPSHL